MTAGDREQLGNGDAGTKTITRPVNRRPRRFSSSNSRGGRSRRPKFSHQRGTTSAEYSKPSCSVCTTAKEPKYKCPKCRQPYCSIECCKAHKEKGCTDIIESSKQEAAINRSKYVPSSSVPSANASLSTNERSNKSLRRKLLDDDDIEEGWKITPQMIDSLHQSDWLRSELQDGGLRHLLQQIASTPAVVLRNGVGDQQQAVIERLQREFPNFQEFLSKLLVVAGVLERELAADGDDELNLEEWLDLPVGEDLGPLILKPSPRQALRQQVLRSQIQNDSMTRAFEAKAESDESSTNRSVASTSDSESESTSSASEDSV